MTQKTEQPQDARAIANYILDKAQEYGVTDLSVMKMLKLIFFAHGWSYYFCQKPLVDEQPEAWPYGPVYPNVYWAYNKVGGRGSLPIWPDEKIENKETCSPYRANLSEEQKTAIESVLKRYGPMTAFQLSNITHLPNSPWSKTVERDRSYWGKIPLEAIRDYYLDAAREVGMPEKTA